MQIELLPVERLVEDPDQPRRAINQEALEALAASIQQHGVLQPITVTELTSVNMYRIITGERRWRAAQRAGLDVVPCVVKQLTAEETRTEQLVENLQREDLTPLERARAISDLRTLLNANNQEIGARLGLSERSVGSLLDLLDLPFEIAEEVVSSPHRPADGKLTEKHARYLKQLNDLPELQQAVVAKIREEKFTGDQTGDLVKALRRDPGNSRQILASDAGSLRSRREPADTKEPDLPKFGAPPPQALVAEARLAMELTAALNELQPTAMPPRHVEQLADCLARLKQTVDALLRELQLELG